MKGGSWKRMQRRAPWASSCPRTSVRRLMTSWSCRRAVSGSSSSSADWGSRNTAPSLRRRPPRPR
eukprot:1682208-Alexandrium_andersonii.AAC.1